MKQDIVGVKYLKKGTTDPFGREYSYFSAIDVTVGDYVVAPTVNGELLAIVTAVDISESRIAAFADKVRTITQKGDASTLESNIEEREEPKRVIL